MILGGDTCYVGRFLALIGNRPVILGVADAVMSDNDLERLRWIAHRVEAGLA